MQDNPFDIFFSGPDANEAGRPYKDRRTPIQAGDKSLLIPSVLVSYFSLSFQHSSIYANDSINYFYILLYKNVCKILRDNFRLLTFLSIVQKSNFRKNCKKYTTGSLFQNFDIKFL